MQEGWAASVCPKEGPKRFPLKCSLTGRFDRTAKRRGKPASRAEERLGFGVGPSRMLGWPVGISQGRVNWEMSVQLSAVAAYRFVVLSHCGGEALHVRGDLVSYRIL